MKIYIVVTDVVNDVTYSRKSVIHVWSYDFYDMTLSTGTATSYDEIGF